MTNLAQATEAYQRQQFLLTVAETEYEFSADEAHADALEQLREDVDKARTQMTEAWRRDKYDKFWKDTQ